jgi:hypothetical protein
MSNESVVKNPPSTALKLKSKLPAGRLPSSSGSSQVPSPQPVVFSWMMSRIPRFVFGARFPLFQPLSPPEIPGEMRAAQSTQCNTSRITDQRGPVSAA